MSLDWNTDKTWKRVFEPKVNAVKCGSAVATDPNIDNDNGMDEDDDDDDSTVQPKRIGKCLISLENL